MRIGLLSGIGSLVLFTLGSVCATAQDKHPYHHLHHALWECRDAHKELKESKHDFGGHKEKGLHAIHEAIKQLEHILKHKEAGIKGEPTRGDLKEEYKKYKHHPHLHHALHELRHAHHQLKEAKHDFGGHKEAAMRDIHAAIVQIELMLKHHKG
jgi:hypothetical protein